MKIDDLRKLNEKELKNILTQRYEDIKQPKYIVCIDYNIAMKYDKNELISKFIPLIQLFEREKTEEIQRNDTKICKEIKKLRLSNSESCNNLDQYFD